MKETELWSRLREHLGGSYAGVWAAEYSLATLKGQTVHQALADGIPCKAIWRAVWEASTCPTATADVAR